MKLRLELLDQKERYVMGVSGGPDSMALLDMLYHQGIHLVACLVNYHKREDSDLDYDVVRKYCENKGIMLAYKEVFDYPKGNFQAIARKIRYDFYVQTAKEQHCKGVILAHHQDDFLETVLMQKARGMIDMLLGIAEVSNYHGLPVIRPAMQFDKAFFLNYCHTHQIDYRIDSSNLSDDYTRNYYRHQVLSKYTPAMKDDLVHAVKVYNQELSKQQEEHRLWLEKHQKNQQIPLSSFLAYPQQKSLLRYYLCQLEGFDHSRISNALLEECLRALKSETPNLKINLPVNFVLIKEYDNMYVTKLEKDTSYLFTIEEGMVGDFGFFKIADHGDDREGLALSKEDFPLTIRTRKPGDVIELSYGKKKLSRLFIDAKVPTLQRNLWPVVLNRSQEIILVPKIAKNKRYLLAKPTWFVIQ